MIVAVLDTNVLVSAFPAHNTVPALLIDAWRHGAFHLVVSEHILEELAETWCDPYWHARISLTERAEVISLLRSTAIVTALTVEVSGVATHPEDDLILATAVAAKATYLVTGDRKLRAVGNFQDVIILSPREFLTALERAW